MMRSLPHSLGLAAVLLLPVGLFGCSDEDNSSGSAMNDMDTDTSAEPDANTEPDTGTDMAEPLDVGARAIELTPDNFFPEGVTVDKNGTFYIGSMDLGSIHLAKADDTESTPFIDPVDGDLVSVIGLYADDARNILWVCSSDAGNAERSGEAPVALKAFEMWNEDGEPSGDLIDSWDWPEPDIDAYDGVDEAYDEDVHGFCNDITVDDNGNVYATDSWYPRILRLEGGEGELEEWVTSDVFPQDQWHLNGIDIDQTTNMLYAVENHPGALYQIPIEADGSAGEVIEVATSRELLSPDGLKVLAPNMLVTAEGANEGGGVTVVTVDDDEADLDEVISGFNQVATFALHQASAWIVENQGDHFWDPDNAGAEADAPFRVVEVPLDIGAGAGVIEFAEERFFPEGSSIDADGNLYVGSMDLGTILRVESGADEPEAFIEPDEDNQLVSVLGLYADDGAGTLWVCNSDAGNAQLSGEGPVALKAFDLESGELMGSWDWPAPDVQAFDGVDEPYDEDVHGFCNDITVDDDGNVYATDSWYPRILRLEAGADEDSALEEWVVSDVFPQDQWHLNGIDIDRDSGMLYAVENHPGALYAIPIEDDGSAGEVVEIETSRPLLSPDGLKVVGENLLAAAEGQPGGMALIEIDGEAGHVRRVSTGLDGIATFAFDGGSAWLVENQGDHFWNPDGAGADANKPFRLVEVPLNLE